MKLTPLDIRHKDFKRGMRGYVDEEVDAFLDEVADDFERLFKENIEFAERLDALQEKIDHYRTLEETLQKTLVSAQRSAEELKANAQKEAQLILHEAELKARQMVNESYADKQSIEKQIVVLKSGEEDFRFKFRSLLEGYLKQLGESDKNAGRGPAAAPEAPPRRAAQEPPARVPPAAAPVAPPVVAAPPVASPPPPPPPPVVAEVAPPPEPPVRPVAEVPSAPPVSAPAPVPGATLGEPDDLLADVETEVDDNEFKW